MFISLLFLSVFSRADENIKPTIFRSVELYNTKQIDINIEGAQYQYGGFITRAKSFSTNIVVDNGPVLSYNAIFQYLIILGENFSFYPKPNDLAFISVLNLINGDVGYKFLDAEIGISNSFNFYFTRRVYHRSSIYIGYGKDLSVNVAVSEDDRLNSIRPNLGFGVKIIKNISSPFFK